MLLEIPTSLSCWRCYWRYLLVYHVGDVIGDTYKSITLEMLLEIPTSLSCWRCYWRYLLVYHAVDVCEVCGLLAMNHRGDKTQHFRLKPATLSKPQTTNDGFRLYVAVNISIQHYGCYKQLR